MLNDESADTARPALVATANADMRPTDLWTVTTTDGHRVRATLLPQGKLLILVWFIDDKPEGAEDFGDWDAAMRRADQLRLTFQQPRES